MLSTVIPCLNEEGSLQECIDLIRKAAAESGQTAGGVEILVVDNGSTDQSKKIAQAAGARVIDEPVRGYGSAILRGLHEAKGDYILIGDADNTYDWRDGMQLVSKLKDGADFAIGDRINGQVEKGAMPVLHQKLGTPVLTFILNSFFGSTVHDINCGLRAIRREAIDRIKLKSPGMEFASEMVINASKAHLKFAEMPIRYYKRREGQAKLRTFRDGWRHLRFILLAAPFPVFVLPAILFMLGGIYMILQERLGYQVLGGGLLLAAFQVATFGVLAKATLWVRDYFMVDRAFGALLSRFKLEYGILLSLVVAFFGVFELSEVEIGGLIRGGWLIALAIQIFFSSFLLSMILMRKKETI